MLFYPDGDFCTGNLPLWLFLAARPASDRSDRSDRSDKRAAPTALQAVAVIQNWWAKHTPWDFFGGLMRFCRGECGTGVPGDDNRLCGFLPPEPPSFPEVPWANRLIEPPLLKLQRLRSASVAGFTRGLMLGNASPVQKFFARPVAVVNRFAPTLPARSRATRSHPVGRVTGRVVLAR